MIITMNFVNFFGESKYILVVCSSSSTISFFSFSYYNNDLNGKWKKNMEIYNYKYTTGDAINLKLAYKIITIIIVHWQF